MALLSPRRLTEYTLNPQRWPKGAQELADAVVHADRRKVGRVLGATAAVAALTAVDVYAMLTGSPASSEVAVTAATTVRREPAEVFAFWRRFESFPGFMAHVLQVRVTGPRTSRWRVGAPFGRTVEFDAEITDEESGRRLCWRAVETAEVQHSGCVELSPAPGDRGTEVKVTLTYRLPGGPLGAAVARWAGEDPRQQLDDDLRRAKQVLETGEVVRSDGALGGKRARAEFPQRPAQPPTARELAEARA